MKLLIPVAGKGSRLYPHTLTTPKPLLKVAGKPIVEHVIDRFSGLDIDEIILVISPGSEAIVYFVKDKVGSILVSTVYQEVPLGLGHAVYQGIKQLEDASLMVALGDTIFDAPIKDFVDSKEDFIVVKSVEDPHSFGVVEIADGKIIDMEEKPAIPKTNLAIIGVYFFSNLKPLKESLEYVIKNDIKVNNEYQLTDGLRYMLKNYGWEPKPVIADLWLDCGKYETLLQANKVLLDKTINRIGVELLGTSVLIHPVYIGKDVIIEKSVIGPYVSIDDASKIDNSVVSDSIINAGVEVTNAVVKNSIVSDLAIVEGKAMQIQLGGFSKVKM